MGTVHATLRIRNPAGNGASVEIRALVDTGATLTKLPAPVLHGLGIRPLERRKFKLANGKFVRRQVGNALISIEGHLVSVPVAFGGPGEDPLIGVTLLEVAGLAPDPVKRKLVPVEYLML